MNNYCVRVSSNTERMRYEFLEGEGEGEGEGEEQEQAQRVVQVVQTAGETVVTPACKLPVFLL